MNIELRNSMWLVGILLFAVGCQSQPKVVARAVHNQNSSRRAGTIANPTELADREFDRGNLRKAEQQYLDLCSSTDQYTRILAHRKAATCFELAGNYNQAQVHLSQAMTGSGNSLASDSASGLKLLYLSIMSKDKLIEESALRRLSLILQASGKSKATSVKIDSTVSPREICESAVKNGNVDPFLAHFFVQKYDGLKLLRDRDKFDYGLSIRDLFPEDGKAVLQSLVGSNDRKVSQMAQIDLMNIENRRQSILLYGKQHGKTLPTQIESTIDTSGFGTTGYWPTGVKKQIKDLTP